MTVIASPAVELYGVMAEFPSATELVDAAHRAYEAGYRRVEAYSPFPIEELPEVLHYGRTNIAWVVLFGAIIGGVVGFGMQVYAHVIDYPINVGGKPDFSWVAFIPVTFELTILFAGLSAVLGMLLLNGLPEPYHPVFNVPAFEEASRSRFFLAIETRDLQFDYEQTRAFLSSLNPLEVHDVEL